ncbi:YphA family membrane protein [Halalkalibacter urbisdiaboli]|uniref:YphA family membrane protein n=1 Tax=Halalkalibacter urbisdiaboli TaxID=1960589 RepID=UPI000B43BEF8|nr:hypothetical protein [Halalkalibacter urbisdiaboli]
MDGVFIYWFGWMAWALVTFLLPKTKARLYLAIFILLLIILIPHQGEIVGYHVNFGYIVAVVYCSFHFRKMRWPTLLYTSLISCIIASAYASYHLILLYDPVISLYDSRLVISAIIFGMAYFTFSTWKNRFLVTMSGLLQGEWMYTMIVKKLFMTATVGSLYFFDIMALSLTVNSTVWFIHFLLQKISTLIQEKKNSTVVEA